MVFTIPWIMAGHIVAATLITVLVIRHDLRPNCVVQDRDGDIFDIGP